MNFRKDDLWSYLSSRKDKKIVMYGMGNGADKILAVCERYGIEIADFFASDGFVRGHLFHGKVVLSYSDVKAKYGAENIIVLLSFASSLPDVLELFKKVAYECEMYAPDVPVCGSELFNLEFYESNKAKIEAARALFADEESRRIFDLVIDYKLRGEIDPLFLAESERDEVYRDLLCAEKIEYAVDAGAYNGDTARELASYAPNLKKIWALEPDARNFRKLATYAEGEERFEVIPLNFAAWSRPEELIFDASGNRNSGVNPDAKKTRLVDANAIDNLVSGRVDYIKYDVEGSEREALFGSVNTIKTHSPALLISAYHRSGDIFELPLLISKLFDGYKLYLRRYPYVPAWDLNIIALKTENI